MHTVDLCQKASEVYFANLGMFANDISGNDHGNDAFGSLIRDRISCFEGLSEDCESPIEQIMAAILAFTCTGYGYPTVLGMEIESFGAIIYPQCLLGKYRVDFCIQCHCDGIFRYLIIECDGHNFHEKTKEQAARDKKRDRDLSAIKATVIRFTGSEIYRNPTSVKDEIESLIFGLMDDVLSAAGIIQPNGPKVIISGNSNGG